MKKILVILLSLVMLMCLFSACGSKEESPEAPKVVNNEQTPVERELKKMAGTITKSELEACYPAEYWVSNTMDDVWAKYEKNMKPQAAQYGENVTCSFEVTANAEVSAEELEKIAGKLGVLYDIQPDAVEKACKLSYTYRIAGSILAVDDSVQGVTVVRIHGQWYKYPF